MLAIKLPSPQTGSRARGSTIQSTLLSPVASHVLSGCRLASTAVTTATTMNARPRKPKRTRSSGAPMLISAR